MLTVTHMVIVTKSTKTKFENYYHYRLITGAGTGLPSKYNQPYKDTNLLTMESNP